MSNNTPTNHVINATSLGMKGTDPRLIPTLLKAMRRALHEAAA
jgi:shikimate 5-dehydrogenase